MLLSLVEAVELQERVGDHEHIAHCGVLQVQAQHFLNPADVIGDVVAVHIQFGGCLRRVALTAQEDVKQLDVAALMPPVVIEQLFEKLMKVTVIPELGVSLILPQKREYVELLIEVYPCILLFPKPDGFHQLAAAQAADVFDGQGRLSVGELDILQAIEKEADTAERVVFLEERFEAPADFLHLLVHIPRVKMVEGNNALVVADKFEPWEQLGKFRQHLSDGDVDGVAGDDLKEGELPVSGIPTYCARSAITALLVIVPSSRSVRKES